MPNSFDIENGILFKYRGTETEVVIPDNVKVIGPEAFAGRKDLTSVTIPNSVTEIGIRAFESCMGLSSITIPDSVKKIGKYAFHYCTSLSSVTLPNSEVEIEDETFSDCVGLADESGFVIVRGVLYSYHGKSHSITIPDSVTAIGKNAFGGHDDLTGVTIPDSVTTIGNGAFDRCKGLTSITIPNSVTMIGERAFRSCTGLTSFVIPNSITKIPELFRGCTSLLSIRIPDSITEIEPYAFESCPKATIVCGEGSYTHNYCLENKIAFIFDYQFEAFHGVIPQSFEKLASPFLADEDNPFIFISYSHKDRDAVLPIIKELYESGWKIWYDEGLTIGDAYDETLETHVKDCAAFLLFVSGNSIASHYCRENEIPWAIESGRPIVKCILEEGKDIKIQENAVVATVPPSDIEPALQKVSGLTKGENRIAKGISVVVNPADREGINGDQYAYCLYSANDPVSAKAILLDAKNSGCTFYDAEENGRDDEKLQGCACLVVFLDKAFLSNPYLTKTLINEFQSKRDIAVCQLEPIEDDDLPQELKDLYQMQWLNYAFGINADMNTKLIRHLQKRGCRNTSILPGFEYEITDQGIVLKRYTGLDPDLWIESEYGGIPVVEIGEKAFENRNHLKTVVIFNGPTIIRDCAFQNCTSLTSITIPDSVSEIGMQAFSGCIGLTSIIIPNSVKIIGTRAFSKCINLTSIVIPDSVSTIGNAAFSYCTSLSSITIPGSVSEISGGAFSGCKGLTSVTIQDGVTTIGNNAFDSCTGLTSITIPGSVTEISTMAFNSCSDLTSITIPDSVTEIGPLAFNGCRSLQSISIPDSVQSIGREAFNGCRSLADNDGFVIVRDVLYSYYGSTSEVTIPDNVKEISSMAFSGRRNLTSITIPRSVKTIGIKAFYSCKNLTSITIPDSVQSIGRGAFDGCRGLADSNGFIIIKGVLYSYTSSASEAIIPRSVTKIQSGAFGFCEDLTSVTIPDSVQSIGKAAFTGCSSLRSITIPGSVTEIGDAAFKDYGHLIITCPPGSTAWNYCHENGISVNPLVSD